MVSAGLHFLGVVLRYLPDYVLQTENDFEKVKKFLSLKMLAEHEDEQHQSFLATSYFVLGVYEYMNRDISIEVLV